MNVQALDHIVLNVANIERSLGWYGELVGLKGVRVEEWRRAEVPFPSVRVNGGTIIDLVSAPRDGSNMDHLCLVVDRSDIDAIAADPRFDVVSGPVTRFGARGDGRSVYVNDPDGNLVEFRCYDD